MGLRWRPGYLWNETIWNPSMIPTALWLDAADASTITLNGSTVSQWNDKSGNARNALQPTAVAQPTYQVAGLNSKPAIGFNGTNNILGFNDQSLGKNVGALSYFIVFIANAPATTDYRALFDLHTGGVNDRASLYPRQSALEAGGRRLDSDSYQFQQATTLGASATIGSVIFNYSAATLGVGLNGNALSFRAGGFQTAGNTSDTDSNYIAIGASVDAADRFAVNFGSGCNCVIAEFLCLQSAPSDPTRQKIEGYLANKWGLTANLPAGHPYKNTGPLP
jgi:hypothetical protein